MDVKEFMCQVILFCFVLGSHTWLWSRLMPSLVLVSLLEGLRNWTQVSNMQDDSPASLRWIYCIAFIVDTTFGMHFTKDTLGFQKYLRTFTDNIISKKHNIDEIVQNKLVEVPERSLYPQAAGPDWIPGTARSLLCTMPGIASTALTFSITAP